MAQDSLRDLVGQLQRKTSSWKSLVSKGQELTQEDLVNAEKLQTECGDLKSRIEQYRKVGAMKGGLDDMDRFLTDPSHTHQFDGAVAGDDGARMVPSGSEAAMKAIASWMAGQSEVDLKTREVVWEDGEGVFGVKAWNAIRTPDYKNAFRLYLRHGRDGVKDQYPASFKLLQEALDDQGGYLVPLDVINRLVQRKPTPTRVSGMVSNINTSREFLEMMKVNYNAGADSPSNIYTTGFRVTKTGENPTSVTQARVTDTNLFGTIKIPVHTFMITGLLTNNMVEDSAINILQWVEEKFNETVEILYDDKVINGTGKQEPNGILLNPQSTEGNDWVKYLPSLDANTVVPDALFDVVGDIPEQYENNIRWLLNKTSTFRALRKMKDLNDRYLFGGGYQDSGLVPSYRPADLIGYPFTFSGLVPNIAANAYPLIAGDFQGYQKVNRIGFSIQVLRELYAELNQVALVGRVRFGGQVVEPWRLRCMKIATS